MTTDQYCIPKFLLSILCIRSFNGTFVQCRAGSRLRRGTGPVVFSIDNAVVESEEDFRYTDDQYLNTISLLLLFAVEELM